MQYKVASKEADILKQFDNASFVRIADVCSPVTRTPARSPKRSLHLVNFPVFSA